MSSVRIPRSRGVASIAVTQKSARSGEMLVPTANDHPTVRPKRDCHAIGSIRTLGTASRRPRDSATTMSAAGYPRTTGRSGARSSITQREANDGPRSTTARR